ncbi:UNVERIFIED_CONTAM: hypothetical protein FKN15_059870 [Acipenser sinensis]
MRGTAGRGQQSRRIRLSVMAMTQRVDALYKVFDVDKLGLNHFPPVETSIAALVQTANLSLLSKDAVCPNKQCRVTEVILKKAYAASAFSARLGNYNSILVAYKAHLVRSFTDLSPSVQQLDELRLISRTLLWLSKFSRQAVGRNLAALVAAHRQLWFSQACVSEGDKTALLDTPSVLQWMTCCNTPIMQESLPWCVFSPSTRLRCASRDNSSTGNLGTNGTPDSRFHRVRPVLSPPLLREHQAPLTKGLEEAGVNSGIWHQSDSRRLRHRSISLRSLLPQAQGPLSRDHLEH